MTKHEYHIALVLIALVTAGVLGYQWLNTDSYQTSQDCTLALYFSGPNGCGNKPNTASVTAHQFTESIENYFTPEKKPPFDRYVDTDMIEYTHERLPVTPANRPGFMNESALVSLLEGKKQQAEQVASDSLFIISDRHSKFLNRVLHKP